MWSKTFLTAVVFSLFIVAKVLYKLKWLTVNLCLYLKTAYFVSNLTISNENFAEQSYPNTVYPIKFSSEPTKDREITHKFTQTTGN